MGLLLLASAGLLVGLGRQRSPEFAAAIAVLPTDRRAVVLARSADGRRWTVDPKPVASPADTPDLVVLGDRVMLYYLHGLDDVLVAHDLATGQERRLDLGADCDRAAGRVCVDPAALALPGGGVRLYFAQSRAGVDPADDDNTRIRSARSEDGWTFVMEPGTRLPEPGRVDPDPVLLSDGRIRLYTTRLVDPGPGQGPAIVVESATSVDGLQFQAEPGVRLREASATRTVALPEGGQRTWYHDFDGSLRVADSADGLVLRAEEGAALGLDPVPGSRLVGAEAPGVVFTEEGWLMALSTAREPWWPFNLRAAREAVREAGPQEPPQTRP